MSDTAAIAFFVCVTIVLVVDIIGDIVKRKWFCHYMLKRYRREKN